MTDSNENNQKLQEIISNILELIKRDPCISFEENNEIYKKVDDYLNNIESNDNNESLKTKIIIQLLNSKYEEQKKLKNIENENQLLKSQNEKNQELLDTENERCQLKIDQSMASKVEHFDKFIRAFHLY